MSTTDTQNDNVIDGQVTEVKAPDNALVILNPQQFATELFKPFEDQLASAKRAAGRTKYDITTKDGMAKAKELRATFVSIRTTADKAKTAAKRPIDESGKLILAHYNKLAEAAKAEEAKHDQAIKDEEARIAAEKQRKLDEERARVEALQNKVDAIRLFPETMRDADSGRLRAALDDWSTRRIDPAEFQDHVDDALTAMNTTVDVLRTMLVAAEEREAEARRVAAEREELARLRAEQEKRDQEERQRQEQEAAATAARERELAEMRATQERQNRAMQQIQSIQQLGMREGDARALLDNLEYAESIEVGEERFNGMAPMAKMAKDMAVASLKSKYAAQLALELPQAWDEAHAEYAARTPVLTPIEEDETGFMVGAAVVSTEQPVQDAQIVETVEPGVHYVDQDDSKEVGTVTFNRPHAYPTTGKPSDEEIIDVLSRHYGETRNTIAAWLLDIDQLTLVEIKVGAK